MEGFRLERLHFEAADIHVFVVVVDRNVASVAVENAGVIGEQILLLRKSAGQRLAPNLHADLALRCQRARHLAALKREELRIGAYLFEAEGCLVLAHLDVEFRKPVPVGKKIEPAESRASGIRSEVLPVGVADREPDIALGEFAFEFEIELLREVADDVDARAPKAKTIFDRGRDRSVLQTRKRRPPHIEFGEGRRA